MRFILQCMSLVVMFFIGAGSGQRFERERAHRVWASKLEVTPGTIPMGVASRVLVMCDPGLKVGDKAFLAIPDHSDKTGNTPSTDHLIGLGYSQHHYGLLAEIVTCEPNTRPKTVMPEVERQCPQDFMPHGGWQ